MNFEGCSCASLNDLIFQKLITNTIDIIPAVFHLVTFRVKKPSCLVRRG